MNEAQTEHLHAPLHAEPAATDGINRPSSPPRPPARPWPLRCGFVVGVLVVALAMSLAVSLVMLRSASATASRAIRQAARDGSAVTQLSRQLPTVQAHLGAVPPGVSHYGLFLRTWTNNQTGNISSMTLNPPVVSGGQYTSPVGMYVSVVPVPG